MAEYVVQRRDETDDGVVWTDLATVEAPVKARRSTILKKAVGEWDATQKDFAWNEMTFRVLDEASALCRPLHKSTQTNIEVG